MFKTNFSEHIKNFQPLFVICGCTGTGKSDLGIELAKQFNGEVINADSMQIYKGLDIATNKVTVEEMQDVPHHMMSFVDPCESKYNVHQYRDAVLPLVQNLWDRGKLPIIVGGTGYYMEAAIYNDNLIRTCTDNSGRYCLFVTLRQELIEKFSTCDLLYDELKRIDPASAAEIHKNATFKVLRALEIFYSTGVIKSEHHKRQREGQAEQFHLPGRLRFKNTFLFTLDAEKEVLRQRLDRRVEGMLDRGLVQELDSFYSEHREHLTSHGILQCIGLKEFLPYLKLPEAERSSKVGQKLLNEGVELVKLHTRQYARTQRKWFYNRIHLRGKYREVPRSVALNTSTNFYDSVVPFAVEMAEHFLSGHCTSDFSSKDASVLMPLPTGDRFFDRPDYVHLKGMKHCAICGTTTEIAQWESHLKGKKHRKAMTNLIFDLSNYL